MDNSHQNTYVFSHISCIISSVLKQWRIIILLSCFCAILFDVVSSLRYSPLFSANAILAVVDSNGKGLNNENASTANKSIEYLFNSQYMKNMVNDSLKQDSFKGNISTYVTSNTNFVHITVTAPTQKDAYFELKSLIDIYGHVAKRYSFGYYLNSVEDITFSNMPLNDNSHVSNYMKGLIAGLILTIGYFVLKCYFTDNMKSSKQVNDKLDARLFAKIPREFKRYQKWGFLTKNKTAILVSHFKTGFSYVEAMNKLASKVEETCRKNNDKSILITSSLENEGKSSIAVNLAISLAKNKKRVIVIDGDLRKPALHKIFEYTPKFFLSDILERKHKIKECIVSLKKEHIDVIFGKPHDDSQTVLSEYDFKVLLRTLKRDYDYIIVDSAPSRYIADTSLIASSCDITFLVVKQNGATCQIINDTIYQLSNASANISGVIYNGSVYNPFQFNSAYGYRYGYYRYRREGRS